MRWPGRLKTWTCWNQELVQKVSADSRIPADLIESLETSGHSWIDDLLAGVFKRADDLAVFHRVKRAVRDLAAQGQVILIGHGSIYMTRDLPGGVHVRLIAPLKLRIKSVSARFQLSPADAPNTYAGSIASGLRILPPFLARRAADPRNIHRSAEFSQIGRRMPGEVIATMIPMGP